MKIDFNSFHHSWKEPAMTRQWPSPSFLRIRDAFLGIVSLRWEYIGFLKKISDTVVKNNAIHAALYETHYHTNFSTTQRPCRYMMFNPTKLNVVSLAYAPSPAIRYTFQYNGHIAHKTSLVTYISDDLSCSYIFQSADLTIMQGIL